MQLTVGGGPSAASAVTLRPAVTADDGLLAEAFLAGRPELAALPSQLVALQRQAQRAQFDRDFPGHVLDVIETERPVGSCWHWADETELRLLDISVLSAYRGHGIGRSVLTELSRRAVDTGRLLRLSVWSANVGAIRLYRSVGFTVSGEQSGYLFMQLTNGD